MDDNVPRRTGATHHVPAPPGEAMVTGALVGGSGAGDGGGKAEDEAASTAKGVMAAAAKKTGRGIGAGQSHDPLRLLLRRAKPVSFCFSGQIFMFVYLL